MRKKWPREIWIRGGASEKRSSPDFARPFSLVHVRRKRMFHQFANPSSFVITMTTRVTIKMTMKEQCSSNTIFTLFEKFFLL